MENLPIFVGGHLLLAAVHENNLVGVGAKCRGLLTLLQTRAEMPEIGKGELEERRVVPERVLESRIEDWSFWRFLREKERIESKLNQMVMRNLLM